MVVVFVLTQMKAKMCDMRLPAAFVFSIILSINEHLFKVSKFVSSMDSDPDQEAANGREHLDAFFSHVNYWMDDAVSVSIEIY